MLSRISSRRCALTALFALLSGLPEPLAAQPPCRPGMPCARPPAANSAPAAQALHPSVVRIENELAGQSSLGSGALIAKDAQLGWILTCAHLFDDGVGQVSVLFPLANHRYLAEIAALDRKHDLALLVIRPPQAAPLTIAAARPAAGEKIVWHGFGQGEYRTAQGTAQRAVSLDEGRTWDALEWLGGARQGDSGGPALNERGELVAVITGSDGQISVGSDCLRIRHFLSSGRVAAPASSPSSTTPAEVDQLRRELAALKQAFAARAPTCNCPPPPTRDELLAALAQDARFRGPAGPVGPAGPQGRDGSAGRDGAAVDDKKIVEQVLERLPRPGAAELEELTARLAALEAAFQGQIRYRLRRVPVASSEE